MRHVIAAHIPADEHERVNWLFEWWGAIDRWIDDRRARVDRGPIAPRTRQMPPREVETT